MATIPQIDPGSPARDRDRAVDEQTRARYPDETGYVERDGVRTFYEVYGAGDPAILFVPPWSIVHARIWKAQIPDFARRHRVVAFDPRGNGRSDRPGTADAYAERELAGDLLAVLDAARIDRAVVVSLSSGAQRSLIATSLAPDRVLGLVFISPAVPLDDDPTDDGTDFEAPDAPDDGWGRFNRHSWVRDLPGFLQFFFEQCFTEPHSTKQIEDATGWGAEIGSKALILSHLGPSLDEATTRSIAAEVRCPTLVIQGDDDRVTGLAAGVGLAAAIPRARLEIIRGGGHIPNARDPVLVNRLIRDFIRSLGTMT